MSTPIDVTFVWQTSQPASRHVLFGVDTTDMSSSFNWEMDHGVLVYRDDYVREVVGNGLFPSGPNLPSSLPYQGPSVEWRLQVGADGSFLVTQGTNIVLSTTVAARAEWYMIVEFNAVDGDQVTVQGVVEQGREIELSGDFSGNLAANTFLVFADENDVVARQRDQYVFFDEDWEYG